MHKHKEQWLILTINKLAIELFALTSPSFLEPVHKHNVYCSKRWFGHSPQNKHICYEF